MHALLEKYAIQTRKINRDTGHELQLLQEIEDAKLKINLLNNRLQEVRRLT